MSAESQPTGNTNLKKQDLSQLVMKWKNFYPYGRIAQRYTKMMNAIFFVPRSTNFKTLCARIAD